MLKNSLDLRRYDYYTIGTYDRTAERYVPDDPAGDERHLRYDEQKEPTAGISILARSSKKVGPAADRRTGD